jgi:hypothetical protein
MSGSFEIRLGRDEASAKVAQVHEALSPNQRIGLMQVLGVSAERELRAWFTKRDADSPNKKGWPRQHFWARIAKRTAFDPSETTSNTATIAVADPALAAKIYGATIRATGNPAKNLAIPMQAAAYGVLPRSGIIPGLFYIRKTNGNGGFLVARQGKDLTFFYRILPQVTVPKDPQALPPADQLGTALAATAESFFRRNSGGDN